LSFLEILLPWLAILLVSLSFHEAAHAWAADRLGDPTARQLGRLTLNPLSHIDPIGTIAFPLLAVYTGLPVLGWAKPVPVNWARLRSPRRDFALVALAGPVSNVILAAGVSLVLIVLTAISVGSPQQHTWLVQTVSLNMLLAVFNMIPIPPLDGGNVLSGIVPASFARGIDQIRPYGFLILYALLFTGVFSAIVRPVDNFVWNSLQ
jgi:Zn-dependent protease